MKHDKTVPYSRGVSELSQTCACDLPNVPNSVRTQSQGYPSLKHRRQTNNKQRCVAAIYRYLFLRLHPLLAFLLCFCLGIIEFLHDVYGRGIKSFGIQLAGPIQCLFVFVRVSQAEDI